MKRVFDKKVDAKKFSKKHGTAYWEYALSFEKDGEPYIFVPIVRDNKVEEVMLVLKDKKKIRFYFNKDDASKKAFFDILIKEKTAKAGSDVRKGNVSNRLVCGWREITWMFENKDGSVSVYSSYDYFCVEVDAAYVDTDLGGDTGFDLDDGDLPGGSDLDNPIDTTKVKTPCDKIKNQISVEAKIKTDSLKDFAKTSQKQEKAFREYKNGTTSHIVGGGEHMVNLGFDINTKGIYHNHSLSGVHIQSAGDVSALIELARYQDTINGVNFAADAYIGMVSSNTHYIIMFNGKYSDLPSSYDWADLEKWNDWQSFDRYRYLTMKDLNGKYLYSDDGGKTINDKGLEEIFFKTLKFMGLKEKINLMKIRDNIVSEVTQNIDGSITSVPCK